MELKLKLVTSSPGGWWWVGGWTKTKLMLFSTQVEVVVELKVELSLAKIELMLRKLGCQINCKVILISSFFVHI